MEFFDLPEPAQSSNLAHEDRVEIVKRYTVARNEEEREQILKDFGVTDSLQISEIKVNSAIMQMWQIWHRLGDGSITATVTSELMDIVESLNANEVFTVFTMTSQLSFKYASREK